MDKNIITLQKLYESFGEVKFDTWLDGLNYSQAFLVVIGAGPWKIYRRQKIQLGALQYLGKNVIGIANDLYDIPKKLEFDWSAKSIKCFPLSWQQKTTLNLINWLYKNDRSMESFSIDIYRRSKMFNHDDLRKWFYDACGSPNGTKVLSLFCRDKLKIDSFPVDRHVKRILQEHNLPTKENQMIELCRAANLDPRKVATGIIKSANVQNPDWNKLIGEIVND